MRVLAESYQKRRIIEPSILISSNPSFPNGALTFSNEISKILGKKLTSPRSRKFEGDYTILCSPYALGALDEIKKCWGKLPKPIVVVVHDSTDLIGFSRGFWNLCRKDIDTIVYTIPAAKRYVPDGVNTFLLSRLPYKTNRNKILWRKKRNVVCSIGRLAPEKGFNTVAKLSNFGFDVVIAGFSTDRLDDFYYIELLKSYGCTLRVCPSEQQKNRIYDVSKVFFNFTMLIEKSCSVEYTVLEAMSRGCVPIVGEWMKEACEKVGIRAYYVECAEQATGIIRNIFEDDILYREIAEHNFAIMKSWDSEFKREWDVLEANLLLSE